MQIHVVVSGTIGGKPFKSQHVLGPEITADEIVYAAKGALDEFFKNGIPGDHYQKRLGDCATVECKGAFLGNGCQHAAEMRGVCLKAFETLWRLPEFQEATCSAAPTDCILQISFPPLPEAIEVA